MLTIVELQDCAFCDLLQRGMDINVRAFMVYSYLTFGKIY